MNELRGRSNGRGRERKQRGRAHYELWKKDRELLNTQAEGGGEPGLLDIERVEGTSFASKGTSDVQDVKRAGA
jgi:hypothetical protein